MHHPCSTLLKKRIQQGGANSFFGPGASGSCSQEKRCGEGTRVALFLSFFLLVSPPTSLGTSPVLSHLLHAAGARTHLNQSWLITYILFITHVLVVILHILQHICSFFFSSLRICCFLSLKTEYLRFCSVGWNKVLLRGG